MKFKIIAFSFLFALLLEFTPFLAKAEGPEEPTPGWFIGVLGGACPGCIVGLFPAVLGIFGGAAAGLDILPFNGLELQVGSAALLIMSVWFLSKPAVCRMNL